jgi:hypothetical protein
MALSNQAIVTSSVITSTSQHKRDYSEKIRRKYPSLTKIMALVRGSEVDYYGKPIESKGLIEKRVASRLDPEWATYAPIDVFYTATGGSATALNLADTTAFAVDDVVVNMNTMVMGIVATVTNTTDLVITTVTGQVWTAVNGDIIAMLGQSFEEGSSRYNVRTKELTTNKTYLTVGREAVSLAETVMKTPQYTDEGMMDRYWTDHTIQILRKLEAGFILSVPGTSGQTSVTIGGTAYTLYTMQGILNYAGSTISMGGNFNWETFNTVLYPQMPKIMLPDETIYMVCGRKVAGIMNQWAQNKYLITSKNDAKVFGVTPERYVMGGGLEVELIVHDVYEQGVLANQAVFFQSSDLVYRYMEGLDIQIKENIQLPSTMGTTNELRWAIGLQSMSAGDSIIRVTDLIASA